MQSRNILMRNTFLWLKLTTMLLCDGSVSDNRVCFISKDKALLDYFRNLTKELGYECKDYKRKATELRINNQDLVKKLLKIVPTYRTKPIDNYPIATNKKIRDNSIMYDGILYPNTNLPERLFKLNRDKLKEILQLIFSMEGGVVISIRMDKKYIRVERKVFVACQHPKIREDILRLLSRFDISADYDSKNRCLQMRNNKQILKLVRIGFLSGNKVTLSSSIWCGVEKNKLLYLAGKLINEPKGYFTQFKSKKEAIDHFKMVLNSHQDT